MEKSRAIVDGILYDISTAEKLGDFYSPYEDVVDTLYRTKNGEFFLHCSGNKYVRENIYPCTDEEARTSPATKVSNIWNADFNSSSPLTVSLMRSVTFKPFSLRRF